MSDILLFSYGTLQFPEVQRANFGRLLEGEPDLLRGYRLGTVTIDDPEVAAESGAAEHPVAIATGIATDEITGMVFRITPRELAAADAYEVDAYVRRGVALASGRYAFAYVAA